MKSREISARRVAVGFIGWLIATNVFVGAVHFTGWWLLSVAAFLCTAFLPGLAILRIMHIAFKNYASAIVYSFGLSLLVLILSGLAVNQLLPLFGVARPLELPGIIGVWDVFAAAIVVASIMVNKEPVRLNAPASNRWPKKAWLLVGASVLLLCLAVLGAFRLNNGGDALIAQIALCYSAVLIAIAFIFRRRLPDGALMWLMFAVGLAVLLMTSLRGWDIMGHDIEREFRVYTLTHLHGRWDIAFDRDPYNACLSITILPEVFAKILNISGLAVFKVILQIVFAVCPVVVYILVRRYTSKLGALVGSMLFICYPTFINDSAMLTRQGVAYLFFALALLVISNQAQKKRYKLLFVLCAIGAALSHYSTAYMFVALFVGAVLVKMCITWWLGRHRVFKFRPLRKESTVLSPIFAGLVFLMTFIWYSQITGTSNGLVTTVHQSFSSIPKLFTSDNRSSDTSTALLFSGGKSQIDLYESYLTDSKAPRAANVFYMPPLTSDDMPLTDLGKKAHSIGINASIITALRQNFAKVLQVLALAGVIYATYRLLRKKPHALGPDYVYLSLAGLVLLVFMVVMPVLSVNYGILRAFQQALIFLILPITLLLAKLGSRLWGWLRTCIATFGMILLFLLFTGLFAQVLGGASPTVSMNNSGLYYGLYYSSEADQRSFIWLKTHLSKGDDVRAANFNRAIMHDPAYPFSKGGILPTQIEAHTIVYFDPAQIQAQKLYTYHDSSPIIMEFTTEYYDSTKDQIYSTGSTGVYR